MFHISTLGYVSLNILLWTHMVRAFTQILLTCNPNQFLGSQYSSPWFFTSWLASRFSGRDTFSNLSKAILLRRTQGITSHWTTTTVRYQQLWKPMFSSHRILTTYIKGKSSHSKPQCLHLLLPNDMQIVSHPTISPLDDRLYPFDSIYSCRLCFSFCY